MRVDDDGVRDVTIVGAGPVGLSCAFWAGMREASCRIVDALPEIGGQCTTLYPEKWIFDVPGHPRVLAKDLIAQLRQQALEPFDVPVHLETRAEGIAWEGEGEDRVVCLTTNRGEIRSRAVIVAGGHGAFEPKKLPVSDVDLTPWEGRGVSYLVGDKSELEGKRVVVVGGGDSACDWALNLLDTAGAIALVHRREEFRAHEATVAQIGREVERRALSVHAPYVLRSVGGRDAVEQVVLQHASDPDASPVELGCDAILLQLGFLTKLGPLKNWGFELARNAIQVDAHSATNLERVWACGDVATFDGKLKLIATGFAEAATAVAQAVHSFRPDMRLQPAYSTNTGVPVPAGVAG